MEVAVCRAEVGRVRGCIECRRGWPAFCDRQAGADLGDSWAKAFESAVADACGRKIATAVKSKKE
jgi:hypothetical protein